MNGQSVAVQAGRESSLVDELDAVSSASARYLLRRVRLDELGDDVEGFVGESEVMGEVHDLVERIADSDASVLVTGESGTGKDVIARAIHRRGRRARGPFVAVNSSAVPDALFESELFGHARGAFTDAREARAGLFVQARGGTLFLDEIGDMPLPLQPKILRALQERKIRPVGSTAEVPIDVRIVSATNRDLDGAIRQRRFREDLYFRLNVVQVAIPPLRARVCDVMPLARHFLAQFAASPKAVTGIAPAAAEKLVAYPWPGNVRELQNCIERAVALARSEEITAEDLPEKVRKCRSSYEVEECGGPLDLAPMAEVERRYVQRVLAAVGGNKMAAARVLGFDRRTLYRKIERWGGALAKSD